MTEINKLIDCIQGQKNKEKRYQYLKTYLLDQITRTFYSKVLLLLSNNYNHVSFINLCYWIKQELESMILLAVHILIVERNIYTSNYVDALDETEKLSNIWTIISSEQYKQCEISSLQK